MACIVKGEGMGELHFSFERIPQGNWKGLEANIRQRSNVRDVKVGYNGRVIVYTDFGNLSGAKLINAIRKLDESIGKTIEHTEKREAAKLAKFIT